MVLNSYQFENAAKPIFALSSRLNFVASVVHAAVTTNSAILFAVTPSGLEFQRKLRTACIFKVENCIKRARDLETVSLERSGFDVCVMLFSPRYLTSPYS
jgi:hypothetical protein